MREKEEKTRGKRMGEGRGEQEERGEERRKQEERGDKLIMSNVKRGKIITRKLGKGTITKLSSQKPPKPEGNNAECCYTAAFIWLDHIK